MLTEKDELPQAVFLPLITSDAANFREVRLGSIAPRTLFRSGDPIASRKIAAEIAPLAEKADINCIINLAASDSQIKIETENIRNDDPGWWYKVKVEKEQVIALNMNQYVIPGSDFNKRLARGLSFMAVHSGPYLIHCFAGVDRTGFVCALLEAFMGASLQAIIDDYLASFKTLWTSSIYEGNDGSSAHILLKQLGKMSSMRPLDDKNLGITAMEYMLNDLGLKAETCQSLKERLGWCSGK
jgi:protein-tyrosine phosphatase